MGMDAVSLKGIGMVVGRKTGIEELNLRENPGARSVRSLELRCHQACAQQVPCEPQVKSCGRKASQGIVSPLPLPPISVFPVPLKFLWFNRSGEGEIKPEPGVSSVNGGDKSGVSNRSSVGQCGAPRSWEQGGESFKEDAQAQSSGTNMKSSDGQNRLEVNASEGNSVAKERALALDNDSCQGGDGDHDKQQGGDDSPNSATNENKHARPDESDQSSQTSWVVRIMELRDYWKEKKKSGPDSCSNEAEPNLSQQGDCSADMLVNSYSGCECSDDFLRSVMDEAPCNDVVFDRDSFSRLLHSVSLSETKKFVLMSFLCHLAYEIPQIKPMELWKLYELRFVTSSLDKKAETTAKVARSTANDELQSTSSPCEKGGEDSTGKDGPKPRLSVSPSVAYEITASAASYIHSQTKYILPFTSEISIQADRDDKPDTEDEEDATSDKTNQMNNGNQEDIEDTVMDQTASDKDTQQTDTDSQEYEFSKFNGMSKSEMAAVVATSSVTALVAAEEDAKQATAKDLQSYISSPCEWFICDDEGSHTRYFVIQGSDSLASWQANLFFEPTQFEGFEVLVHRGIYEAAKGIYEKLLPDIVSHLKKHGEDAKLQFTGHSLGGSLSVLLNLMLLIRGVSSPTSLLPVITFGSPCIMCGGDYLLRRLGLPNSHVQAVTMHRDIVPRAFACTYPDHVAEFLKRLNNSFRKHPCLSFQKFLYGSMGQLLILQPKEKVSPPHPLLPSGSGFYSLHHVNEGRCENENELPGALQLRAAQIIFFNTPHPLEILSDRFAYGSDGSISRDHDSSNYLTAINHILRQQTKRLRRLQREQRRQMWWPFVTPDSSMPSQRPSKGATNKESKIAEDSKNFFW
uniref:Fungal lipase-type domain-containing protein n=1 Tax=Araucaria cunninghamii TaxID=56994 RepID=A0A0D6QV69_ARACU